MSEIPVSERHRSSSVVMPAMVKITLIAARLDLGPTVRVTERTSLFSLKPYEMYSGAGAADYDISRDGQRFLLLKNAPILNENSVPIVERKELAQSLYKNVDIGKQIPTEQYAAVAEVLRYVYQLKGKKLPTAA